MDVKAIFQSFELLRRDVECNVEDCSCIPRKRFKNEKYEKHNRNALRWVDQSF